MNLPLRPAVAQQPRTPRVLSGLVAASSYVFVRVVIYSHADDATLHSRDNKHSPMRGHR